MQRSNPPADPLKDPVGGRAVVRCARDGYEAQATGQGKQTPLFLPLLSPQDGAATLALARSDPIGVGRRLRLRSGAAFRVFLEPRSFPPS